MKKNLVSKLIALVSCILMIVAIILNNTIGQYLALVGLTALFVLAIVKWIVPDKKNMLFKLLIALALYLWVLTWIIPSAAASGSNITQKDIYRMSLYSVLEYPWLTVQYFLQQLLFLLAVGGLYGILKETGKYRSILETIAKSMKGKENAFLVVVALVLAILSSVFGDNNTKVYELQHKFDNGNIADAVLYAPEPLGLVAIDSKFPLENYQNMVDKNISKIEREIYEKKFKSDVKKHIDAIRDKYIIPGVTSIKHLCFYQQKLYLQN